MKEFIKKHIINGSASLSLLILYSPLIIGLVATFVVPMLMGIGGRFPFAIYFFPFPFLLLQLIWIDTVHDLLMSKIDFNPNLKTERYKKLVKLSIGALILLSALTLFTEYTTTIDFNEIPIWAWISINFIYIPAIVGMFISYYTYYHARRHVGKLMKVVDTQKPYDKSDPAHTNYRKVGDIGIFGYIKTHKLLKEIINRTV